MATLYLIEQNSILRKRGHRLLVCHRPPASRRYSAVLEKDIIRDLPVADVKHVMVFGNVQVTTSALHILLQNHVELAIFSYSGKLLGQLTPPMGKNIPLRLRQFKCYQDSQFALDLARRIVQAKIANALAVLRGYLTNHPGVFSRSELHALEQLSQQAESASSLDQVRGIEGAAGARYFSLFKRIIQPPHQFPGRTKRPPRDPVNAVLSFGYTVIAGQISALLDGAGLDPFLGFYHQISYGRPSLALDLLEEFRHPLIDRLCATLFNKKILKQDDFWFHPSGGVYLNTSGKRRFLTHLEGLLGPHSTDPDNYAGRGFRPLMQKQVEYIARAILENKIYHPWRLDKS